MGIFIKGRYELTAHHITKLTKYWINKKKSLINTSSTEYLLKKKVKKSSLILKRDTICLNRTGLCQNGIRNTENTIRKISDSFNRKINTPWNLLLPAKFQGVFFGEWEQTLNTHQVVTDIPSFVNSFIILPKG
jgi:hypothetical protein